MRALAEDRCFFLTSELLLLSRFSRVRLCATPQTAAHQASPSLGFSRQEHWSGLPFPSPMHESEKLKQSRSVVSDSQQPHGLQPTRLLPPWDFPGKSTGVGVIAFSEIYIYMVELANICKCSKYMKRSKFINGLSITVITRQQSQYTKTHTFDSSYYGKKSHKIRRDSRQET